MRTIDADVLIEKLGIAKDCNDCKHNEEPYCRWKPDVVDICEAINDAPTIEPEQRWTPCTPDTMPDDYTDVLVWFEYFRYGDYNCLYQTYGIGSYSTEYDSWMINHETGWHKLRVLAWMPMPEAYGGEQE